MRRTALALVCLVIFLCRSAFALEPEPGALFVRVVDTGAGLCCVIKTADERFIVYDAGHWTGDGYRAWNGLRQLHLEGGNVAMMVLSHTDSDHLGGVERICNSYHVQQIVWPGLNRSTGTWTSARDAIRNERDFDGAEVVNLRYNPLPRGNWPYGATTVTILCGWYRPPAAWGLEPDSGEYFNPGSICIRVEFAGKSVLFCGDAVGRHLGSADTVCIATEDYLCDHVDEFPIRSDVLVAPHHGADNGSSTRFIQAVDPTWVIFSAGHAYEHPRQATAERYLMHGVPISRMLRTDRGDNEGDDEWASTPGGSDSPGDDDVDILIRPSGEVSVAYRFPDAGGGPVPFAFDPRAPGEARRPIDALREPIPAWVLAEERLPEAELVRRDQLRAATVNTVSSGRIKCRCCRWFWRRRCR